MKKNVTESNILDNNNNESNFLLKFETKQSQNLSCMKAVLTFSVLSLSLMLATLLGLQEPEQTNKQ